MSFFLKYALLGLSILSFFACDGIPTKKKSAKKSETNMDPKQGAWSIFFLGVDPLSPTRMSTLYRVQRSAESNYKIEMLSAGEGSDAWLQQSNKNIFLIQRSQGQQSIRHIAGDFSLEASRSLSKISQVGDPFNILAMADGKFLFSNYTEASVSLFDWEKQDTVAKISCEELDCENSSVKKFRPTKMHPINHLISKDSVNRFWAVYHDSLDFKGSKLVSNNSQQILFFKQESPSSLQWIDLDKDISGVQGVALKASFPSFLGEIEWKQSPALLSLGLCSRLVDKNSFCKSSLEVLTKDLVAEEVFDLDSFDLRMNGSAVLNAEDLKVYANVEFIDKDRASNAYAPAIVEIDILKSKVQKIYDFNPKYSGYGMLLWDKVHKLLWLGDADHSSKMILRAIEPKSGKTIFESNLSELPFVGVTNNEIPAGFAANLSSYL